MDMLFQNIPGVDLDDIWNKSHEIVKMYFTI